MATNAVSCIIVGHAYSDYHLGEYHRDVAYAGCAGGSSYYAYVQKFTTPAFIGASESVSFEIILRIAIGTDVTLRYALCTSDANKDLYVGVKTDVLDPNQVTKGIITWNGVGSEGETRSIVAHTSALRGDTTYYLMVWAYDGTGVSIMAPSSVWGDFSTTLGYNSGLVWIDTGETSVASQVYIDDGTDYSLYIPYLDTGSSWEQCG